MEILTVDTKNQAAVAELNEDIIFTIASGHSLSPSKCVEREINLQKATGLYREIIDHAKNNKRSNSTALTEEGHDIQNGINFSCFVAGVFCRKWQLP